MEARLDALLKGAVDSGDLVNIYAGVTKGGKPVYSKVFGTVRPGGDPATKDHGIRIMSQTKAVTSLAILQLIERGKLSPDAKLSELLPELADLVLVKGFGADGEPETVPAPRQPTVLELASHSSGFGYDWWDESMAKFYKAKGLPTIFTHLRECVVKSPIVFEPGSDWLYGHNIDMLGFIVEKISGQTLGEYLKENVFEPLGMKDTYFGAPDPDSPKHLPVHLRTPDDSAITELPLPWPGGGDFEPGGHGLTSTVDDYLKFASDLASPSPKLVSKATLDKYAFANVLKDGVRAKVLPKAYPYSNDNAFIPGKDVGHSMVGAVNLDHVEGHRPAGSLAWAGLLNSYFWVDRENGIAAMIATQLLPFTDNRTMDLWGKFEKAVYAKSRAS
ncbi:beta-lactamase/transpeptidase-like protein [Hyaloraphidium curvatum]|nr:beta-lactamase/transpeptidase-like protein [Hyaloraphidium curvatum]